MAQEFLALGRDALTQRDPKYKSIDASAVHALVQAAINVELFTIPLYMTTMYSIEGTHAITGDNNLYEGRLWPGSATVAKPSNNNQQAFNLIFSVFIEEMLHLQLAANVAHSVGAKPTFTGAALQTPDLGWKCYGPENTTIPHILDFQDCVPEYADIKVNLEALNQEQIRLFLAIEETAELAFEHIQEDKRSKYFPQAPFDDWTVESTESDLPMFGSIGWMYWCLWQYFEIKYTDGTSLWGNLYEPGNLQQDLFNAQTKGHPKKEYPGMPVENAHLDDAAAKLRVLDMISGITDQGEGKGVTHIIKQMRGDQTVTAVKEMYQPDREALEVDYKSYTDTGEPAPSADAAARGDHAKLDHFEVFQAVQALLKDEKDPIVTWDTWHNAGNTWTADMLQTPSIKNNQYNLPKPEAIAGALNRLKAQDASGDNFHLFSQAAAGAIAGITKVLNDYWEDPSTEFPYPSMAGSGDRVSICWAVFGKAPNLAVGVSPREQGVLYHACQGLNLDAGQPNSDTCASVKVYHTCRGSNDCKAEGGCGFVQSGSGGGCGGGCGSRAKVSFLTQDRVLCGAPTMYSAPSDNACATQGGCAVPISASQLYPTPPGGSIAGDMGMMKLYDFGSESEHFKPVEIGTMTYKEGDGVYDVAWEAYTKVLEHRGEKAPNKPEPSDLRLAFPPST